MPAIALKDQAALVLAALIGEYSLLIMPFILVAMMDSFGISERQAGGLVSLQLLMMAVASIIVSARLRPNQSVRPLLTLAVLAIAAANTLCALSPSTLIVAAARALTGLGEGAIMAAAGAAVAATAHPHRLYSFIGTAVAVVASIALVAAPWLTEHAGSAGLFWLLAAVPLLLLPLVLRIPRLGQRAVNAQSAPRGARRPGVELLLAFLLLWCGASGLWVYAERIGAHQGLSPSEIGLWLSIGQLAGIPGPLAAAWGEPKIGLRACLLAGCLGNGHGSGTVRIRRQRMALWRRRLPRLFLDHVRGALLPDAYGPNRSQRPDRGGFGCLLYRRLRHRASPCRLDHRQRRKLWTDRNILRAVLPGRRCARGLLRRG